MPAESWKAIVVAVRDPAARKQTAIRKAARIAASTGARITLFHAFSAPFPMPTPMPTWDGVEYVDSAALPTFRTGDGIGPKVPLR
jgi:hypothetical protein